jgi:hypothetical protein
MLRCEQTSRRADEKKKSASSPESSMESNVRIVNMMMEERAPSGLAQLYIP